MEFKNNIFLQIKNGAAQTLPGPRIVVKISSMDVQHIRHSFDQGVLSLYNHLPYHGEKQMFTIILTKEVWSIDHVLG